MSQEQIDNLWKVTSGIRTDVTDLKVSVAELRAADIMRATILEQTRQDVESLKASMYKIQAIAVFLIILAQQLGPLLMP